MDCRTNAKRVGDCEEEQFVAKKSKLANPEGLDEEVSDDTLSQLGDDAVDQLAESMIDAGVMAPEEIEVEDKNEELEIDTVPTGLSDRATTHEEHVQEILAYLGVPYETLSSHSWTEILLSLCEVSVDDDIEDQLRMFVADCKVDRGQSLVDIDRFIESRTEDWDSHDIDIDKKWDILADELVNLSNGALCREFLTKPSGPSKAALTCIWHYPTWYTNSPAWGHVMDRTNPSLRAQYARMGPSPFVRTQNRFPIRESYSKDGVPWNDTYSNWDQIEEKCLKFCRWLNKRSKLILVIGRENAASVADLIDLGQSLESIEIKIRHRQSVFEAMPHIQVIRHKSSKEIKHVVLTSYHSQSFFYDTVRMDMRAFTDLIWNAACEIAGIELINPLYFLTMPKRPAMRAQAKGVATGQLKLALQLRAGEKGTNVLLPETTVRRAFEKTLRKNPSFSLSRDKNGSFVGAIIRHWIGRAVARKATEEWQQSEQAEKWRRSCLSNLTANRHITSAKLRETRRTEEWQKSTAGQN
jgi:hypothetical protein